MGGCREADASGHGVQVVDAEFLILHLTLAACGDFLSQLLDVLFRHLGLCEDFGTKVVNVAGVIGDEQAIGLWISHVTSPLQSTKRNPRAKLIQPLRIGNTTACDACVTCRGSRMRCLRANCSAASVTRIAIGFMD